MRKAWFDGRLWFAVILVSVRAVAAAEPSGWTTDFEQAKKVAAERKLPILMSFSGSDWCTWCRSLDVEVFSRKAFTEYAKDNLVLFLADFPQCTAQSGELAKQNVKLQASYRVASYPSVILVTAEGEVIARTGYRKGGADAYVEHLKELLLPRQQDAPAPVP